MEEFENSREAGRGCAQPTEVCSSMKTSREGRTKRSNGIYIHWIYRIHKARVDCSRRDANKGVKTGMAVIRGKLE